MDGYRQVLLGFLPIPHGSLSGYLSKVASYTQKRLVEASEDVVLPNAQNPSMGSQERFELEICQRLEVSSVTLVNLKADKDTDRENAI